MCERRITVSLVDRGSPTVKLRFETNQLARKIRRHDVNATGLIIELEGQSELAKRFVVRLQDLLEIRYEMTL
jgi:hypothetical protein